MSTEEKSLRIIEFSGKKSDWKVWSRKFTARGNRKGYKSILEGKDTIPTLTQYESALAKDTPTPIDKGYIKKWRLNELAYEDLLLSINGQTKMGKVAFNLVDNCTTDEQPDGNCKLAWERLVHKFAPKTAPSYISLKKSFANSKLELADSNPDEWITDLESMRSEMNKVKITGKTDMSEVDLIIHILANLPEEYEVAVSSLEAKLKDSSSPLDIEEVREELNSRYDRITKHADADLEEKAFAAFKKQYKGGHESGYAECPAESGDSNGNNSNGSGRGPCFYCGKLGHIKADCEKRKADLEAKERAALAMGVAADSEDESYYDELGFNACSVAGKQVCFKGEVSHIQCGKARDMHATDKATAFYAMKSAEEADTSKTMLGRSSKSDKLYQESGNALGSSDTVVKRIKDDSSYHVSGIAQKESGDALVSYDTTVKRINNNKVGGDAQVKSMLKYRDSNVSLDDDDHDNDMVDVVDIKSKEVGSIGEDTEEVCGSGIGGDSSCKDRSLEKICKLEGLRCVETKFDTHDVSICKRYVEWLQENENPLCKKQIDDSKLKYVLKNTYQEGKRSNKLVKAGE